MKILTNLVSNIIFEMNLVKCSIYNGMIFNVLLKTGLSIVLSNACMCLGASEASMSLLSKNREALGH